MIVGSSAGAQRAWARLLCVDEQVSARPWRTLAPRGGLARGPAAVVREVVGEGPLTPGGEALADALAAIAVAMRAAFPDNIFGDLEHMTMALWRSAQAREEAAVDYLHQTGQQIAELHARFGGGTSINFRYTHDFLYGFDWAKWVAREPKTRAAVGPFDPPFLLYTQRRAAELVELIERGDDAKYPPLPQGRARNPFGFSREPEDEARLHWELARRDLLPVQAWAAETPPDWARPFADLRRELACEIGVVDRITR